MSDHTSSAAPTPRPTPPPRPSAGPTAASFGRVDDEGTVWVRTADGERPVGSYPGATPEQALAYFTRKYDDLVAQVSLFEQRLAGAGLTPAEVDSGLQHLREAISDANAVGDLAALQARVEALAPVAQQKREEVRAARDAAREEVRARRTAIVEEAESISAVPAEMTQWRADGQRMKDLFEEWRTMQREGHRLDKRSEDELWKRFSHARSAFDRKRRQHFSQLEGEQSEAKARKEKLVAEAEALQGSTDWGATASAYKQLMDRWRAAGRAGRKDDDALWARFRAAQDAFFAARHADQAKEDEEYRANLAVKEALLTEAEALLPVEDLDRAKEALRSIQERWERAGRVPRADLDRIEKRMRRVEQSVRDAEGEHWRRSDPELRERAASSVAQLEGIIAGLQDDLAKARAAGDERRAAEAERGIAARQEWLDTARQTLKEYGG